MERQKIPGIAVGIVKKGVVLTAKGYGLANVEHQVPVSTQTIFQSGSVGKQFTSAAVMLLVQDGKLSLDDPITKYFTDAPAPWQRITVRHLLTHTSGIPDYNARSLDYRRDYTEDDLTRVAYDLKLEFPPGLRWNYSNTGYVLLGILVHKVSGQFYGDVLRERVFTPLEMKTARVISEADIVPNRAAGYRLVGDSLKNQTWVAPQLNTTADGSLYLSIDDWIAWSKAVSQKALLPKESWARILEPTRLNSGSRYPYGLGWQIDTIGGQVRYHHGGTWQGFKAYLSRYDRDDVTIIVLANLAQADQNRIEEGIAAILIPAVARAKPAPASEDPKVRARLETLLVAAQKGRLSPTDFAYVRSGFFPDMAAVYQEQLSKLGAPGRITLLSRKKLGDDQVYTYEAYFGDFPTVVTLGLAPDGRASQLAIRPK
jgi:CubicO group peptidase (beta-lactamase class C family)